MIRPATIKDAAAIARVHVESWRTTYRGMLPEEFLASLSELGYAERWERVIRDGASLVHVVEDAGELVGFASGGRERAGETAYTGELYAIYLLESAQRRGQGRELLRAIVDGLRRMKLRDMIIWVLRDNRPARLFYERLGGVYVRSQPITIGPATLEEVSYGWPRLEDVRY
ncbi:MAG TPA: GNAT family N-acetyltransferase [Candidatus Dormibacteraeota bacterium]|nr:GNAT family N-acetyltransferase [Candidatus Dormibacteraeota bacterium]